MTLESWSTDNAREVVAMFGIITEPAEIGSFVVLLNSLLDLEEPPCAMFGTSQLRQVEPIGRRQTVEKMEQHVKLDSHT
jgi:hypothetical protein